MNSIEELIALAKAEPTKEDHVRLSQYDKFLIEFKIEASSTESTIAQNIYWAYIKWCRSNNSIPLTRLTFFKQLSKKFARGKNWEGVLVYKVSKALFEINKEEYFQLRAHFRKEQQHVNRKKEKDLAKKQSKASRAKETIQQSD
jgi:hypothetical protein